MLLFPNLQTKFSYELVLIILDIVSGMAGLRVCANLARLEIIEVRSSDPGPANLGIGQVNNAGFESEIRIKIGAVDRKLSRLRNKIFSRNLVFQVGLRAFLSFVGRRKFLDGQCVCVGACCDGRMSRNGG